MGPIIPDLVDLRVQIVRFVDDGFPGFVECEFTDAEGHGHRLIDKVPIFTTEPLDASSKYPRPGTIRCKPLRVWRDPSGREVLTITTAVPFFIESVAGLTEFGVLLSEVSPYSNCRHRPLG
jgi:hypothetical protein